MTAELIEKLRAALDEHERIATFSAQISGDSWQIAPNGSVRSNARRLVVPSMVGPGGEWPQPADAALIERYDPAHVLRTVAAHRKILDRHARGHWCVGSGRTGRMWWPNGGCEDVRDLVSIYFPGERDEV